MLHWPPRPDQPLDEKNERKLAHSLRFVFPRIMAPAFLRFAATVESWSAGVPTSAREPAAVCIWSCVSTLSFKRIGIPIIGPRIVAELAATAAATAPYFRNSLRETFFSGFSISWAVMSDIDPLSVEKPLPRSFNY